MTELYPSYLSFSLALSISLSLYLSLLLSFFLCLIFSIFFFSLSVPPSSPLSISSCLSLSKTPHPISLSLSPSPFLSLCRSLFAEFFLSVSLLSMPPPPPSLSLSLSLSPRRCYHPVNPTPYFSLLSTESGLMLSVVGSPFFQDHSALKFCALPPSPPPPPIHLIYTSPHSSFYQLFPTFNSLRSKICTCLPARNSIQSFLT